MAKKGKSYARRTKKNDTRTDYIKSKIDNTQQNSKCRLYGDKNEIVNPFITETKEVQDKERLGRKGDLLGIVQEITIWPYSQMLRGPLNKFPDFFVWALLLIVHTWNSSPAAINLLYRSNNFWNTPWKSSCVSVSMTFVTVSLITSIVS